ncbi:MAG: hypothetical protein WBC64_07835 [Methylovirgula sp.]
MFPIRKLGQWFGELQTYWQVLTVLFPGVGAVISVVWAAILHVPGYLILFYGSGVFCFLIVAAERISVTARDNAVFGKLRINQFYSQFGKDPSGREIVNGSVSIQNLSKFDLYYQTEDARLVLDGRTGAGQLDKSIVIIQAGATNTFTFASIAGLTPSVMVGEMKLQLRYGKKESNLDRELTVIAEPQIGVVYQDGKPVGVTSSLQFKEVKFS